MVGKIRGVGMQLTRKCNQLCKHCFGNYGPKSKGELSFETVKQYIDQISKNEIPYLCLSGGEPTLYEKLFETIEYANQKRKETEFPEEVSMITNSSWITTFDKTVEMMVTLKHTGLDYLMFSYDQFRPKKNILNVSILNQLFIDMPDRSKEYKNMVKTEMPKLQIHQTDKIVPMGRAKDFPKELWFQRRKENGDIDICSIDKLDLHFKGETAISVGVNSDGLYSCGEVPSTIKFGELSDDLNSINEKIEPLKKLIQLMSFFDPLVVSKELQNYTTIKDLNYDCHTCKVIFDVLNRKELESICNDGSLGKIKDSLVKKYPKRIERHFIYQTHISN